MLNSSLIAFSSSSVTPCSQQCILKTAEIIKAETGLGLVRV